MFKCFRKSKEITIVPKKVEEPAVELVEHTICNVNFHLNGSTITVPFKSYKQHFDSIKLLYLWILDVHEVRKGIIVNATYYPNHVLTKIELTDINKEYVKV
jgi:hypothetical protein